MNPLKTIIALSLFTFIVFTGCKKEDPAPEPDFSKPHEKSTDDFDYYFKSSGGAVNITKFSGTIKSTVKTFDYPFNATTYYSNQFNTESSIKKTDLFNQGVMWSVRINRFDPTNIRPTGGYNQITIEFDIISKTMPMSFYKLETFDDQNKIDSTVSITATYSKWLANNQVHTTNVDFRDGTNSEDLINLTLTSFTPSTGLLKGTFNASGKEQNTELTANLEGNFEVYLVEIVQ